MTRFETITETTRAFGNNSYIEIARKRLTDESGAQSDFLVISRGFTDGKGEKRWTKFVTLPYEPELFAWIADTLNAEAQDADALFQEAA